MQEALKLGGNVLAVAGILICIISGIARIFGQYYLVGFESMTLFNGGTTLLIAACLAKLQLLTQHSH